MRFDYDDINLVPRYSTVDSRSQCDTSIKFGNHTFKNCVIPANMESVINEELAIKLSENGYFYVMHRFGVDNIEFTKMMKSKGLIASISIGVNQDSYDYVDEVLNNSIADKDIIPDYITIDIAHGHCRKMKKMIKHLKDNLPDVFLIAGNVSTIDATRDLDNWGADAIKVGIGPGCFDSESLVRVKNGDFKKISEITTDDYVLTHSGKFEKVLETISYFEDDDLININGNISTKKHKYHVVSKRGELFDSIWVNAEDLDENKHQLILQMYNDNTYKVTLTNIQTKKIVENKGRMMYDIQVENDKSYNVNHYSVHNSACTTYPTTGFGSRNIQASVVHECSLVTKKYIVADGGIQTPADISKSIVLGASICMVGGMLSAFTDSPGRTVEKNGIKYKEFYGSASANQSNKSKRIEGTVKLNPMKSYTMLEYMDYLSECLQSSISYAGGTKLTDLQSVKWF
jgi:IMP dehydrogenase/GMP reductase